MINIKTDSRKVVKGDIFVALKGINSNGDEYIESAISNGAAKIVCEHGKFSVPTINVPDTKKYLEEYLSKNYGKIIDEMTLICITGTNGKTTGAFIIYELLNKLGYKCAYTGTIGYYLDKFVCYLPNTTPDLCSMYEYISDAYDKGYRYFVMEASSQGIDMGRLNTLKFDYVIFTNLTREHLDYHKTMEAYMEVKQRIFKQLKTNGVGIINADDEYYKNFLLNNTNVLYGKSDIARYKIVNPKYGLDGTTFELEVDKNIYQISSPLLGEYNIYNLLPALVILDDLKVSKEKYIPLIANLSTPDGRDERIPYKNNLVVVDYAHTPDGILKVAEAYKKLPINNLYIVFGACGNRDRGKRPMMLDVATTYAKYVIVTDYNLYNEDGDQIISDVTKDAKRNNFEVIRDRYKAIEKGIGLLENNDVLLILGKGHEKYLDVGGKKISFDDREVAKEIIAKFNNVIANL